MSELAIIIPAFNEQTKIATDIHLAEEFLKEHCRSGEIIVVDNGSADNTAGNATANRGDTSILKLISYRPHRGKGYAVKTGILASSSDYVMFIDSGNCVS